MKRTTFCPVAQDIQDKIDKLSAKVNPMLESCFVPIAKPGYKKPINSDQRDLSAAKATLQDHIDTCDECLGRTTK